MSKGLGSKIGIKFTDDLTGDVTGNESAFKVTGKEHKYVNGPLIDKEYVVDKVERYPIQKLWDINGSNQILSNIIGDNGYYLNSIEAGGGYSENLTHNKTYFAKGTLASNPMANAFDGNLATFWRDSGAVPSWLGIDFGENIIIKKLNMAGVSTRIKDFILQASIDFNSWVDVFTGQQTNDNILRTYEFENANSYRYYRVYISSVWTSGYGPGLSEIELYSIDISSEYMTSGHLISEVQVIGQKRIRWSEDSPMYTSVVIEYTSNIEQGQWVIVSNGEVVDVDTNIWIRATLSTSDTSLTPILYDLWLEDSNVPQDKLLITMGSLNRFPTVEGDLTVEYDAPKGNLTGQGGAVDSFATIFTPTDLAPEHNPGIVETITGAPTISINYLEVTSHKGYVAKETITAAPAEITVAFLSTEVINP